MDQTRLTLRTRVQENIGGRTDKDTIINAALDLGLEEIMLRHVYRIERTETELSLALDARSVTLPSTAHQLWEARFVDTTSEDGYPLIILSKNQFIAKYPTPEYETSGEPNEGYVAGGVLYLNRPSDALVDAPYTIRTTTTNLPTLVDDDAAPNIKGISYTLICWATQYLFDHLEQFNEATVWKRNYEMALLRAISADKREVAREPQHQRVGGRAGLPAQYWLIWDIAKVR